MKRDSLIAYGAPTIGLTMSFVTNWPKIVKDDYEWTWFLTYFIMLGIVWLVVFASIQIFKLWSD